jgi:hypothetical protein
MEFWTTAKGTKLPIRLLKGKEYLDVQWRVLWMREDHPDWSIETECVAISKDEAVVKASVRDGAGKLIAQAMKRETPQSFPAGHIEKAETGAIGRALGFAGFGTQFAQDLDEPDADGADNPSIADSPQAPRSKPPLQAVPAEPGSYVMKCAPYKNKRVDQIGQHDLDSHLQTWRKREVGNGKKFDGPLAMDLDEIEKYLNFVERPAHLQGR